MDPLVSVCMPTYNHEQFVEMAIEGVMAQACNFSFELLIGEDESSDRTAEICHRFAEKYPHQISILPGSRSDVIYINGNPTGRANLIRLLNRASGKYIAICEGDDFWTSPIKLQTQVDFLEIHDDFSLHIHDVDCVNEAGESQGVRYCRDNVTPGTIQQALLFERCITQISSALFRAKAITPPHSANEIRSYDWFLYILASESGKIHYDKSLLSAYRVHPGGVWQGMSLLEMLKGEVGSLRGINRYFALKYDDPINKQIDRLNFEIDLRSKVAGEVEFLRTQLSATNKSLVVTVGALDGTQKALEVTQKAFNATHAELDCIRNSRGYRLILKLKSLEKWFLKTFFRDMHQQTDQ